MFHEAYRRQSWGFGQLLDWGIRVALNVTSPASSKCPNPQSRQVHLLHWSTALSDYLQISINIFTFFTYVGFFYLTLFLPFPIAFTYSAYCTCCQQIHCSLNFLLLVLVSVVSIIGDFNVNYTSYSLPASACIMQNTMSKIKIHAKIAEFNWHWHDDVGTLRACRAEASDFIVCNQQASKHAWSIQTMRWRNWNAKWYDKTGTWIKMWNGVDLKCLWKYILIYKVNYLMTLYSQTLSHY
jgi:hypothetical protein